MVTKSKIAIMLLILIAVPINCALFITSNFKEQSEESDSNPVVSYINDYIPSTEISNPFYMSTDIVHTVSSNYFEASIYDVFYHEAYLYSYTPYIFYVAGGPCDWDFHLNIYVEDYPYSGNNYTLLTNEYFSSSQNKFLYLVELDSSGYVHFDFYYDYSSLYYDYSFYGIGLFSLPTSHSYSYMTDENDFNFKVSGPSSSIFTAGLYYFSGDYYEKAATSTYNDLYYISYSTGLNYQELNDYDNWFSKYDAEYLSGYYIFFDLYGEDIDFRYETTTPITPNPPLPYFPVISFGPFFMIFGLIGLVLITILTKRRIKNHNIIE
ncbi:MAG: hypothetical protein JW891_14365 [Candidatus Lokiarchaeota archaeon]|nr:hypothetical protein [Candidatus Lokiarchaeota archaeon]